MSLFMDFLDQELILYHYSSCSCCSCSCWSNLFKKRKAPSFQILSGWNLAGFFLNWIRTDWRVWSFDLTSHFQVVGHDVISHNKVLPPGEWTWSACAGAYAAVSVSFWSI